MALTTTKEDYLRALFRLVEDGADEVRAVDLARQLKLSKSTVSERLQELAAQKLILSPKYGAVTFTKKGRSIAENLTRKHRLIEVFLTEILKMKGSEVHVEAHALEHALSDKVAARLEMLLGSPSTDPHGKHIPKKQKK
jgi:DtxR family transcriptional regulator, Mn-dependent transcriptional regulator